MALFHMDPEHDARIAAHRSRMGLAEAAKFLGLTVVAVNEGWFASAHQLHVKAQQAWADAAIYQDAADGLRS